MVVGGVEKMINYLAMMGCCLKTDTAWHVLVDEEGGRINYLAMIGCCLKTGTAWHVVVDGVGRMTNVLAEGKEEV